LGAAARIQRGGAFLLAVVDVSLKPDQQRGYVVAADVGGTCTDCVVFRQGDSIRFGKALSTPPRFAQGVIDSVRVTAAGMGLTLEQLLAQSRLFLHGSTVVDNAIFTREGARTGLITTAGFEDTLLVTRGAYGRWSGQPEEAIKHPVASNRPAPLVPHARIFGVRERVDYKGAVLEALDIGDVEAAVERLVGREQVEAIAVCLLWSFRNPAHERRVRDVIRRLAPHIHVAISSEVAPVPGEYERTSASVIDAYVGRVTKSYLAELTDLLAGAGYAGPLLVMQGYGGLVPITEAAARPVGMIECGPAAGIVGAQYLAQVLGDKNVIAADMGGTTFKVAVIQDGRFEYAREPMVDRYHYVAPKIDLMSIGAGGGSIVGVDHRTRRPTIGPASAGARPGPICYGLGGNKPTLTDIAAILGYMDPGTFLGGTLRLDIEAAREVFADVIARPLGMDVDAAALGIYKVAVARIADLIRNVTVERGLDPREFALQSFGGSGGLFAGAYAQDLSIGRVIVPHTAAVLCAFGMVAADVLHDRSVVHPLSLPVDPKEVDAVLIPMAERAVAQLAGEGFGNDRIALEWLVEMRYRRQVHQVGTPLRAGPPVTPVALEQLQTDFEKLYEQRYGPGSSYRAAGIELVTFRLKAHGLMPRPRIEPTRLSGTDPSAAERGSRSIITAGRGAMETVIVYDFERLAPGNVVHGPTVVHSPVTTIVVHDGQIARLDGLRNLILEAA
jgi:N-methylhydantoinase A